jgi:threonylcarbamoyladenosine tRNA methylthiotransferase CDKAL1
MQSVYIKTFGCSANLAEGEMMAGILDRAGNEIVADSNSADVLLVNVCTVKGENKALREIRKIHGEHPGKRIVVAGCVTKSMLPGIEGLVPEASIINTDNISSVADAVNGNAPVRILDRKKEVKVTLPRIRSGKVISIVPISQGCASACTYCSTKLVKGNIFSYPPEKILAEIGKSVAEGCREIWLTSQDNGDYGFEWDRRCHLPELMRSASAIGGDFWIRVGMTNPNGVMRCVDELADAFAHPKVFKFIHIPVQAGNNEVLRRMARRYSVVDFMLLVERLRRKIPEMTISTDVICGFPGETGEQFEDTLRLVEETKPDVLNISRFVAREGTAAYRMENQVHGNESKRRSTRLTGLFRKVALERNERWIGWNGRALIDEAGKNGTFSARNYAYKPVVVEAEEWMGPGSMIDVEVTGATKWHLRGKFTG